jgi:hypothetical protein
VRWIAEFRLPAVIEFGDLGQIFLRHFLKFAGHIFVGGDACISRTHRGEFECFPISAHNKKHVKFTLAEQYGIIVSLFLAFRSLAIGLTSPLRPKE